MRPDRFFKKGAAELLEVAAKISLRMLQAT
jgi:hypothetical protein